MVIRGRSGHLIIRGRGLGTWSLGGGHMVIRGRAPDHQGEGT